MGCEHKEEHPLLAAQPLQDRSERAGWKRKTSRASSGSSSASCAVPSDAEPTGRSRFSRARMIEVTCLRQGFGRSADQGKVIDKTGDNRLGRFPEAASEDLLAGPKRNFQVFDPLDFLAEVTCLPAGRPNTFPRWESI